MTIAIHQPNYLPWLGYFSKIHLSDVFVFHDAVQFVDRGYTKRTQIRKAKDSASVTWLTVPVRKHASDAAIVDIQIDDTEDWRLAHLRKIRNTYAGAAFFGQVFPQLEKSLEQTRDYKRLAEVNIHLIKGLCGMIGISGGWQYSSQLQVSGAAEELNRNIVAAMGGSVYLSGTGGRNYQDGDLFEQSGIQLQYNDVQNWLARHPYAQGNHSFVPGLSIVDALMHVGPDGVGHMLESIATNGEV